MVNHGDLDNDPDLLEDPDGSPYPEAVQRLWRLSAHWREDWFQKELTRDAPGDYPDALVDALESVAFHDPAAVPAPEVNEEDLAARRKPEGWRDILFDGTRVLCGWTEDGAFHQYVSTEKIVQRLVAALPRGD